jgi:AraC-like DNA-binding protein
VPGQRALGGRAKIPQKPSRSPERLVLSVVSVIKGQRVAVRTDVPTLVLTLESSSIEARCRGTKTNVDRSRCLLVPAKGFVALHGSAPASRVAVLAFHATLFDVVTAAYAKLGIDRARFARWMERPEVLPRTVWVHETVHRYVFERYVLGEHDNDATRFLEVEILKEIYFLLRDRADGAAMGERASLVQSFSPSVDRALGYIDARLFEPISVPQLASHCGASESTLLRMFRRELGCTPSDYWRTRKLDEALVLVRSGRRSVAEVAIEVGYTNPTAFGHAFRQRFGGPPSSFRPLHPVRRAP